MKEDIKKIFQHHVSIHESEVDPAEIWKSVQAEISPKKKRRYIFWLPMLVGLLGIGYWLSLDGSSTTSPTLEKAISLQENSNTQASKTEITQEQTLAEAESNLPKGETKTSIIEAPAQESKKQLLAPAINNTSANSNTTTENNIATNDASIGSTGSTKSVISQAAPDQSSMDLNSRGANQSSITQTSQRSKNALGEAILFGATSNQSVIAEEVEEDNRSIIAKAKIDQLQKLSALVWSPTLFEVEERPKEGLDLVMVNLKEKNQALQLSLLVGYGIIDKSWHAVSEDQLDYSQARKSSEQALDIFGASMMFSYPVHKNIRISAGLDYQRMYNLFSWDGSYLTTSDGEIHSSTEVDNEGNLFWNFEDENLLFLVDQEIEHYNQNTLIDIPLTVELSKRFNRWQMGASVGVAVNVYQQNSGFRLDQNLLPVELHADDDIKMGMKFLSGLELSYWLSPNWSIDANFQYAARKLREEFVEQKYNFKELNLGLSYLF